MIVWLLDRVGRLKTIAIISLLVSLISFVLSIMIAISFPLEYNLAGMIMSFVTPFLISCPMLYLETGTILQLRATQEELQIMATIDSLTEVPNRAHFFTLAEQYLMQAAPAQPVGLAIIDIDRFKQINDLFGHLAGDQALRDIAQTIRVHVRPEDIFGRFAGDEFILLCPNTTETELYELAHHLLKHVNTLVVGEDEKQTRLSATMGVTMAIPAMAALPDLITKADEALYCAKREGGGRVGYS